MLSEPEAQNELQELSSEVQENQEKNTQNATWAEEIWLSEKDTPKISDTPNTQAVPETTTSSPETIQEQQEIIQDTEEDLEALFGDLIQGE